MSNCHFRIGQILKDLGALTSREIIEARKEQFITKSSKLIGQILLEAGHITEVDLEKALGLQRDMKM